MSRLNYKERYGCRRLLEMMTNDDISSLRFTITNKKKDLFESTSESIDAILSNTENTEAFLKRRKVQRDFIFKYLTEDEGVVIPKNSNKDQLVKKALDIWTIEKVRPQAYEDVSFSALTRAADSQIGMRFPTAHVPSQPVYSKPHYTSQMLDLQSPAAETNPGPAVTTVRQIETNLRPIGLRTSEGVSVSSEATYSAGFDHLALARQFCQWFFQHLNSLNPSLGQPPQEWGPQHFWEDVRLRLLSSAGEQYTEEYEGAAMTSLRLLALARDERLLLSPNLEPGGLKALSSPHGLVLVAVAGTIHRDRECVGIYEQVFGLIRSPLDQNKWKIKFMVLKVRGQEALRVGENLLSPILTWDSNDLQLLCR
ncbi:uncharacterized protein C3orf38 [Oncorhynchus tshawytscha]|uniref:uncharacterized protein C3orf38 n=1 Tax=Oncorhynchus tshawytscha TaxID=74940 RepID=UPI000D0A5294|nr:uncharacterized protein C3orf38 [Oncorhynchus tshawytscha]